MKFHPLEAISPVDGRYRSKVSKLADYFSEKALIQHRVEVEVRYFQALAEMGLPQLNGISSETLEDMNDLYTTFTFRDAEQIKEIEKTTNHDVKAVEYYLKDEFEALDLSEYLEFIHFGLTSQDINNTSIPLSLKRGMERVIVPELVNLIASLSNLAEQWKDIPMLARTHGQPASPTRLGKEIQVFVVRLQTQLSEVMRIPYAAKFGGATGNFNAHHVAYPDIDWHAFGDRFVSEKLGLTRSFPTTQIEHYDHIANLCDGIKRINTILLDLSRDIWQYIAMNYFTQKTKKGEIGSSAMPHKVNPIDFENAEGNLGISTALLEHLAGKLPISRLQRDLTDSTVLRSIGVPLAHSYLAFQSIAKGLEKLQCNEVAIEADLDNNWAVVAEAIQTILRREGYPKPYEALLELTRGKGKINEEKIRNFIDGLVISENVKSELRAISPFNYTGI